MNIMNRSVVPSARARMTRSCVAIIGVLLSLAGQGVVSGQDLQLTRASSQAEAKTVLIPVEGMSCGSCAARIKKTLTAIDGVLEVEVSLAERQARVRYHPGKVTPERLVSTINELGYKAGAPEESK